VHHRRDREYFALLLEDATHHAGPDFLRQATLWNVERFFGWVAPISAWQRATGAAR
jgi:ureidoacrylate peracid hydrolase